MGSSLALTLFFKKTLQQEGIVTEPFVKCVGLRTLVIYILSLVLLYNVVWRQKTDIPPEEDKAQCDNSKDPHMCREGPGFPKPLGKQHLTEESYRFIYSSVLPVGAQATRRVESLSTEEPPRGDGHT